MGDQIWLLAVGRGFFQQSGVMLLWRIILRIDKLLYLFCSPLNLGFPQFESKQGLHGFTFQVRPI